MPLLRRILWVILIGQAIVSWAWAMPDCPRAYNGSPTAAGAAGLDVARLDAVPALAELEPTEQAIAYLTTLQEHHSLGATDFHTMLSGIEATNKISNPYAGKGDSIALIHGESLQNLLSHADLGRVQTWLRARLGEVNRVKLERDEARGVTRHPWRKMEFHPIPPGEFDMGGDGRQVHVVLTHDIEVMTTKVTQGMWVEKMGANPSKFAQGPDSVLANIQGKAVLLQPDNPVESVTWWSVLEFANRLSIQEGLPIAYDLSQIHFDPKTSAENGDLQLLSPIEGDRLIRINASGEDIYQARGYRLPTSAEIEFLLRNLGRSQGKYPHGLSLNELFEVGWFLENAVSKTYPIGSAPKALVVNGKEFPDLVGNVKEWAFDRHQGDSELVDGVNPRGSWDSLCRTVRGSDWGGNAWSANAGLRLFQSPNRSNPFLGFRLVRTLK